MTKLIIHITGASGSGKTTLGNKLKKNLKNKVVIKDLDDLRDEFIKNFYAGKKWTYIDEVEYQKFIDKYIKKQSKPIIFVGLNDNTQYGKNKELYYDLHSKYNYYIDLDISSIIKQKCTRLLNDIQNDNLAMNDLINNNDFFIKQFADAIKHECSIKETIKINTKWYNDYKQKKYKFMSRDKIYNTVLKILSQ